MRYLNINGNSSVVAYEINSDAISVLFKTGDWYTYSYRSAGIENVEKMKELAQQGYGLCSYIHKHAYRLYEK